MNGVSSHDSARYGITGLETTRTNEMNFVVNHAPGAGSILHVLNMFIGLVYNGKTY